MAGSRKKFIGQLTLFKESVRKEIALSHGRKAYVIPNSDGLEDEFFSLYLTDHPNQDILVYNHKDGNMVCKIYLDSRHNLRKERLNAYGLEGIDGENIRGGIGIEGC